MIKNTSELLSIDNIQESKTLIKERDLQYVVHPWSPINHNFDLIFTSGKGYIVNDIYGNSYIDAASLNLTCGYKNKKIVNFVLKQLRKFPGTDTSLASHDLLGKLAETLSSIFPKEIKRTMFVNSGSEGIEAAIFIASSYWDNLKQKRNRIISFSQGYHGSTYLSRGLTKLPRIAHPLHNNIIVDTVDLPSNYINLSNKDFLNILIDNFKNTIKRSDTELPIAVIVEPFLNVGGAIKLPVGFLQELKNLCDTYNTLMIIDEVFTGYGRTGKMFAFEHENIVPDIIVSSKGLAGGYAPIAVVNFKEAIYETFVNDQVMGGIRYGHTTSGHAIACAAALATLKVIEEEKLIENAMLQGNKLYNNFIFFKGRGLVKDVRSFGLILVLEMDSAISANIVKKSCKNTGMLVRQNSNSIMITPPLSINSKGVKQITNILTQVLENERMV
jgi:adenosylmethionine-8-amino-7-oxononanoate aminotransferase